MKKLTSFLLIQFLLFVSSCICPNGGGSTTYITIHHARGLLYSFDENGIFPYLDEINRNELGISVLPDSTTERVEFAQNISIGDQLYACEDPNEIEYVNSIDSLNIFTKYKFDDNHPALSKVNDILRPININGEILLIGDIGTLNFTDQHLKFIQSPIYDTLQFEITGRIVGAGSFKVLTNLLVLN
jgi:hypothetical protein